MTPAPVEHYALPVQVYGAGLVFARVGGLVMLMPGVGEASVPTNVRLAFAFTLSLALYPVLAPTLPPVPGELGGLFAQVILEVLIGLGLGALLRLFLGVWTVTGEIVSLQTTLSFAQTTNPAGQPTTTVATFLSLVGLTLVFATGLHHQFIAAVVRSYALFVPGKAMSAADFGALAVRAMGQSFALGVQLAAPVIVFSLVFNVASGLIARAMPQFQVFFVATPLSVLLGLAVLAMSLGLMGLVWVDAFQRFLRPLT